MHYIHFCVFIHYGDKKYFIVHDERKSGNALDIFVVESMSFSLFLSIFFSVFTQTTNQKVFLAITIKQTFLV